MWHQDFLQKYKATLNGGVWVVDGVDGCPGAVDLISQLSTMMMYRVIIITPHLGRRAKYDVKLQKCVFASYQCQYVSFEDAIVIVDEYEKCHPEAIARVLHKSRFSRFFFGRIVDESVVWCVHKRADYVFDVPPLKPLGPWLTDERKEALRYLGPVTLRGLPQ